MRTALKRIWAVIREVTGDDAYERYLAHWRARHAAGECAAPLNRASFYREEQTRKWDGVRRCC
jgi:uncharacterized short protein YbdD (DUF466 family)